MIRQKKISSAVSAGGFILSLRCIDIIVMFSGRNLQFKVGNNPRGKPSKPSKITVLSRELRASCLCVCQGACVKTPKNQAFEKKIMIW